MDNPNANDMQFIWFFGSIVAWALVGSILSYVLSRITCSFLKSPDDENFSHYQGSSIGNTVIVQPVSKRNAKMQIAAYIYFALYIAASVWFVIGSSSSRNRSLSGADGRVEGLTQHMESLPPARKAEMTAGFAERKKHLVLAAAVVDEHLSFRKTLTLPPQGYPI